MLHNDRHFSANPDTREISRRLFAHVAQLPMICPHGHTDPLWFSENQNFKDPAQLLIVPDHYVLRMLVSQGVPLRDLGVVTRDGSAYETDGRAIWKLFATHYHLFRGTPVRHWFDYTLQNLFGATRRLSVETADDTFDQISEALASDAFRPRALFDRFNIEVLATTDACTDDLAPHAAIAASDWNGRVVPTYRPDGAVDPDAIGFLDNVERLGALTGEDISTWSGYLTAHRTRRAYFVAHGAKATDHGHPSARTADLDVTVCDALYQKALSGETSTTERETFRAQMLTEMAGMSIDDGLVMQLHPGSHRNHSSEMRATFGDNIGFDVPRREEFVDNLKPLLAKYGMDRRLSLILFTLDESAYARELAPLAAVYPSLKLGPAWWFHDSPEGMMRYRKMTTETAGFYNTVGFNDDTRAFPSIPARHDLARRIDCAFLGDQVARHLLDEDEAAELAVDLAYGLAKRSYNL